MDTGLQVELAGTDLMLYLSRKTLRLGQANRRRGVMTRELSELEICRDGWRILFVEREQQEFLKFLSTEATRSDENL